MTKSDTPSSKFFTIHNFQMILLTLYLFFLCNAKINSATVGKPVDDIALDCGSSGNSTRPGESRSWVGDVSSKLFSSASQNNSASRYTEAVASSSFPEVPYRTARFSLSEFTYTIPVTANMTFVRLHFSSTKYEDFNISKAFFSVQVGQYTFLSNFSVMLNSELLDQGEPLVKEFCVAIENSTLTIKFSPTASISDSIAFVNGIEIVSMPTDLYYTDPEGGLKLVGGDMARYFLKSKTAMENVYRLNIGGPIISPINDNFFRSWEDMESEKKYLTTQSQRLSGIPALQDARKLRFIKISPYIAPEVVYQTARNMGKDNTINTNYNLTWEFPLHSGFYYMVRLHFCEIEPSIKSVNYRKFNIFMANQTAEKYADVIEWSDGQYVPYFKDYIVPMAAKGANQNKANLSIALQAIADSWVSIHADAILNGVEIFKLNDSNGNLAGPNPDPIPHSPSQQNEKRKTTNQTSVTGIIFGALSGAAFILSLIGFLFFRRCRKVKGSSHISLTTTKSSKTGGSSLPSDRCRYFSLVEIIDSTNNFDEIYIIGIGGFGNVYKGYIDNGTTPVAVKRLKSESSQGIQEFKTEIELLSHLRHRHLVSLIGYCNEEGEMILVYDYMAHGTLRGHLYKTENPPLTWKQRLDICIGAANGLHYLHTGTKHTIIHRDVKTTNILLDEKWVAKVSDFGLSKTGPTNMSTGHLTTVVKGSIGYLDPEYYRRQQLTEKSDVYSFGVVLCEVLCGRPPLVRTAEKGQVNLAEWVQSCYHNGRLNEIIDPYLRGKIAPECLKKYSELTVQCMLDNGTERPSMKDIVWGLEFAMQLQNNAEGNDRDGGAIMKTMTEEEMTLLKNNDNESDGAFTCSWADTTESKSSAMTKIVGSSEQGSTTDESRKGMSGTVFSEITDYPNGR